MLKKVQAFIDKHKIFKNGEKILVAVSGGADSVCLLDVLFASGKYALAVAHFNHLTRGKESDADELFVEELAKRYKLPFYIARKDIKKLVHEMGGSFQAVAREERYAFLKEAAAEFGADKIALAHHADDQAETIFLHVLRGSGLKGLGGMAPLEGQLARPLLVATREEIETYLASKELTYRVDASNYESYYTRNKFRLEVMPLLKKFNPALSKTLSNMADILRSEENFLGKIAEKKYTELRVNERNGISLDLREIQKLDIALKRRIIFLALAETAQSEKDFTYRHVEDVLMLASGGSGHFLYLPHGVKVKTTYDKMHFTKDEIKFKTGEDFEFELKIPGKTVLKGIGVFHAEFTTEENARSDAHTIFIEEKNLHLPLIIRNRKPGDIFRPLGGRGRVKIKEFFIDLHIEREKRDAIPLIVDANGEIIWVAGIRPGEKCRVTEAKRLLKIEFILHSE